MFTVTSYIVFWVILFVLFGAVWYNFDRRFGVRLYRSYYAWTHKDPLPAEVERGFIFNQPTRKKVLAATILSTVQSVLAVINIQVNPLVELMMWVVEVPVTLVGFHLGPFLYRLWQRKDAVYAAVDRLESGELDLKQELAEGVDRVMDDLGDRAEELFGADETGTPEPERGESEREEPGSEGAVPPESSPDPHEALNRFIRERKGGTRDG